MATSGQTLEPAVKTVIDRLWKDYLTAIMAFEGGNIPYMYVDTPSAGHPTVGVGHNLDSHLNVTDVEGYLKTDQRFVVKRLSRKSLANADPLDLPIKSMTDPTKNATETELGRQATPAEIQADYDYLKRHKLLGGATLANKRLYTTLELKDGVGEELFKLDLSEAIKGVVGVFTQATFDAFPLSCQAALIDMEYNPGLDTFPTLVKVVKAQGEYAGKSESEKWEIAATKCHRVASGQPGAMDNRNSTIEKWFKDGAAKAKAAEAKVEEAVAK